MYRTDTRPKLHYSFLIPEQKSFCTARQLKAFTPFLTHTDKNRYIRRVCSQSLISRLLAWLVATYVLLNNSLILGFSFHLGTS